MLACTAELAAQLRRAKATLLETVELKRRIVEDLRPSLLDNLGLCAAIESYCEDFARMSSVRCDTDVAINIDNREATLTIALFRIVQESLTNILKYARAGMVSVTLKRNEHGLVLRVIDDGIGITEDALQKPMSHGLLGMRERALLLGGTVTALLTLTGRIGTGRKVTGTIAGLIDYPALRVLETAVVLEDRKSVV